MDNKSILDKPRNMGTVTSVTGTAPIVSSGGAAPALSLVNDAAGTITQIDTGPLSNLDTDIPTSKAVTTAIAGIEWVLFNDVGDEITEIDTGALANLDTVIPTSKAVLTAIPTLELIITLGSM